MGEVDKTFVGLDIGGTKCAISVGMEEGGNIRILSREEFPTAGLSWRQVLDEFARRIDSLAHPSTPSTLSNPSNPQASQASQTPQASQTFPPSASAAAGPSTPGAA